LLISPFDTNRSVLQKINSQNLHLREITLLVKRDDLIHPEVSGNKWRKLEYILEDFYRTKKQQILTFGGAYSNHLLATACACYALQIPAIGIVRGEELSVQSNPILKRCDELKMRLIFVARQEYARWKKKKYASELEQRFPTSYIVPEGGACEQGLIGCAKMIAELPPFDHLFVAQGTTTTSCGLLLGTTKEYIHVVPALKNFDSVGEMKTIFRQLNQTNMDMYFERLVVHDQYHFGGYAKQTTQLEHFIDEVEEKFRLPLDKVYTAKAFYALMNEIQNKTYDQTTIIFLHTGGLYEKQINLSKKESI